MSNENKPETPVATDAGTPVTVASDAPAVNATGVNDQSASADAAGESAATGSQPESAGDAQQATETPASGAASQPEVLKAPAPSLSIDLPPPAPKKDDVLPPPAPKLQPSIAPTPDAPKAAAVVQELPSSSIAGFTPHENVNRLLAEVPKSKHGIIHFMVEYARDMAPRRPIPANEGAAYQVNLYRQLHALINKEDEHFRPLFTAVLRMFENEADGCFRASHAFRFMELVSLNRDERESFNSLIDALRLLGPVQGRKEAARQVSLSKALAKNMTDSGRSRILSYFDGSI